MKGFIHFILLIVVLLGVAWWLQQPTSAPTAEKATASQSMAPATASRQFFSSFPGVLPEAERGKLARIMTSKGEIVFEFLSEAPKTVSNFVQLARVGFYNGLTFHRREEGFVIQGGDPNGDGTGGPGYTFEDEPVRRAYARGTVAMANRGPNTNGSQFFIMLANVPLPPQYTIFGYVTDGMSVADKIQVGDAMTSVTIE